MALSGKLEFPVDLTVGKQLISYEDVWTQRLSGGYRQQNNPTADRK
jgi:hypothetical protein